MDQTSLYVPNYQRWQNFYDKIIDNDTCKRTDMSMVNDLFHHNSDSSKHGGNSNVSLKLVSPVKMLTEQAKNEIERSETDSQYKSASNEKLVQKRQSNRRGKKKRPKKPSKSKRLTKKTHPKSKSARNKRGTLKINRKKNIFDKALK